MASYSYRTATTTYPCYVPVLGASVGAGRMRLAAANIQFVYLIPKNTPSIVENFVFIFFDWELTVLGLQLIIYLLIN